MYPTDYAFSTSSKNCRTNVFAIYPALYLKSSIKLTKGVGDKTDPYILGI